MLRSSAYIDSVLKLTDYQKFIGQTDRETEKYRQAFSKSAAFVDGFHVDSTLQSNSKTSRAISLFSLEAEIVTNVNQFKRLCYYIDILMTL